MKNTEELIWKALADPTRRRILDLLTKKPLTTGDLCRRFKKLSRYGVMKHLSVLENARLVLSRRDGRLKWHFLNAVPIQQIYERWVSKYVGSHSRTLSELKQFTEIKMKHKEQ